MSKEDILAAMEEYLDEENISYTVRNDEILTFPVSLGKNHPFRTLNFYINITDTRLIAYCRCPVNANEEKRDDTAVFLTYANYGVSLGNFEMDFYDGEIRYKMALMFEGDNVIQTHEQMRNIISLCIAMFKKYGKGILAVNYGNADPEAACKQCEDEYN